MNLKKTRSNSNMSLLIALNPMLTSNSKGSLAQFTLASANGLKKIKTVRCSAKLQLSKSLNKSYHYCRLVKTPMLFATIAVMDYLHVTEHIFYPSLESNQ